ncbi:phospholipase effector Tle1 domain-containing protein [Hymenobacter ruricola]|uniref:DUF2235 domain-containing protein n=1 Tax=Hymenobacter ruricola TaxID=2791023 RepID=A0ABS0HZL8_9BACT|nr:DUF2235 domain-containing protein [Hymenobacter ruricola]MBF9219797.1 DUF2235 domain-containing protein [Hymenobacter ruricola]
MANALDQAQATPAQDPMGKSKVGEPDQPNKVGVKIKAAIFFDGTGNNENNTKKRIKDPYYMTMGFDPLGRRSSYKNAYSNVALLHFMHQKKVSNEKIISVYMEGIGTTNDGDDDISGGGFGSGPTGIPARVTEGIKRLESSVKSLLLATEDGYLEELTIYAFGFSRGAAAARHFCARRTNSRGRENNLCGALGADAAVVKLKFVGLFDTVSSFDENDKEDTSLSSLLGKAVRHKLFDDYSFRNDVPELHLWLDDPTLEKVVQLRAADEYRVNFSITNIVSATSQHKGLELLLPGAHSDIGGGYQPGATEKLEYKNPAQYKLAAHFQRQGWYLPAQLVTTWKDQGKGVPRQKIVTGTRTLGNSFQHVSLAVMLKLIVAAECEIKFDSPTAPDERTAKYTVPPGRLATVRDQLAGFAVEQFGARPAAAVTAPVADADYRWLRQHYLHLSWSNSTGMEMRVDTSAYDALLEARSKRQLAAMEAARQQAPADSSGALPPMPPMEELPPNDSYLPTRLPIEG